MHKSYNDIVQTCKLASYKFEPGKNQNFWAEYWVDENYQYKAIFPENETSVFPLTYYTKTHDENF